jgi:hypothetical protein
VSSNVEAAKKAINRIQERSRNLADEGKIPTNQEIQIMQLNTQGALALLLMDIAISLEKQTKILEDQWAMQVAKQGPG